MAERDFTPLKQGVKYNCTVDGLSFAGSKVHFYRGMFVAQTVDELIHCENDPHVSLAPDQEEAIADNADVFEKHGNATTKAMIERLKKAAQKYAGRK